MPLHRCTTCCLSVLIGLSIGNGARAADAPADNPPWYLHPLSVVTGAVKAVGSAAGSVWVGFSTLLGGSDPYDYMPSQLNDDDRQFFATLDALGLKLSEIRVGGGALSRSSYRFVAARDPSDVDVQRAEQKLAAYSAASGGVRNAAKQHIARAILDVVGDKGFVLSAVTVELWPWPDVRYEISARSRPPEAGERRIIDAAQQ